ncbi:MAG: protein kinase [Phycisphaerales bacterium]|nr:MAG: protein kinase [Phycisphaerales bacterium]
MGDRIARHLALRTMVDFASQMLDAVAYAHPKRVMHCDLKPENCILFRENRLRLADFGIAKVALRTIPASGSGTIGSVPIRPWASRRCSRTCSRWAWFSTACSRVAFRNGRIAGRLPGMTGFSVACTPSW